MIDNSIYDSDKIFLESVESYIKKFYGGKMMTVNPQEQLVVTQNARDYLYSEDAARFPRIAAYVLQCDLETDLVGKAFNLSASNLMLDPNFIDILMQNLAKNNNAEENCITGAYLTKLMNDWIVKNTDTVKTAGKKKGEETTEEKAPSLEPIMHVRNAVYKLLGNIASLIQVRCGNIDEYAAIAVAALIAMNNDGTIKELIKSDLPVTADVLDVIKNPTNFVRSILLLEKNDIPAKPTTNQTAFLDSLKRWVYKKLNEIPTQSAYQVMVSTYGLPNGVDVSTKFINPKDCGTQYPNLLQTAKIIINK